MFGFFRENALIKVISLAVIVFILMSNFSSKLPSEILSKFQKKEKAATSNLKSAELEDRLKQIENKHLKRNQQRDKNKFQSNSVDCPTGTEFKEEKTADGKLLYCQDLEYFSYKNGPFLALDKSGRKIQTGEYKNNKQDGLWSSWLEQGKKSEELSFSEGIKSGDYKSWYPNSILRVEGQYQDDLKSGIWKIYDPEGKILSSSEMKNNRKNGKTTNYYSNGKIESLGDVLDDKQEGVWTYYRKDGSKQQEIEFKKGRKSGLSRIYDSQGKLQQEKTSTSPSSNTEESLATDSK